MKLNRKRSVAWEHFMKIFHYDDLSKPVEERRIEKVHCQLCHMPTITKYKYHGATTQMLNHIKTCQFFLNHCANFNLN